MKIAIYGAGAIGGLLGARLAAAGEDVTLIARGPHLAAIKAGGLRLTSEGSDIVTHPAATEDPREAGPQDAVIVTLKSPALPSLIGKIDPLLGPATSIVTAIKTGIIRIIAAGKPSCPRARCARTRTVRRPGAVRAADRTRAR